MAHLERVETVSGTSRSTHWSAAPRVTLVSLGVGLASFLATEFMHYLLVPDIGRQWERLLAEGVSAVIVALLTAKLMYAANQRREAALLRMQVISEMNHHIRNALTAISLTAESMQNQQSIRVISESVDRIEWTLREILPRPKPLQEKERDRLGYFQAQKNGLQAASPSPESQAPTLPFSEDHRERDVSGSNVTGNRQAMSGSAGHINFRRPGEYI